MLFLVMTNPPSAWCVWLCVNQFQFNSWHASENVPQHRFSREENISRLSNPESFLLLFEATEVILTGEPFREIVWEETPENNCLNNCLKKKKKIFSSAVLPGQSPRLTKVWTLVIPPLRPECLVPLVHNNYIYREVIRCINHLIQTSITLCLKRTLLSYLKHLLGLLIWTHTKLHLIIKL